MQEVPVAEDDVEERYVEEDGMSEQKKWIMKAVRKPGSLGIRKRVYEMWTDFLDLLTVGIISRRKQSETLTSYRMQKLSILVSWLLDTLPCI
jgi:hypothetical protein